MENTYPLYDFLDGTLSYEEEQIFFGKLSTDDNLKNELRDYLSFNSAIKSGVSAEAFPVSSKSGVFASLGLTLPYQHEPSVPKGFFLRYKQGMITGLATAVTAALFYILFLTPDTGNNTVINQSLNQNHSQLPVVVSKSNDLINNSQQKPVSIVKYIYVPVEKNNTNQQENIVVSSEPKMIPGSSIHNLTNSQGNWSKNPTLISRNSNGFSSFSNHESYNPVISQIQEGNESGIIVGIRGSSYWHLPTATINPENYSGFNNLGLTVFYDFDRNLSAGIEVRQENFYLQYEGSENNKRFKYEQQPNFTSFSGAFKYRISTMGVVNPFGQLTVGGNQVGAVGRMMLGLEYSPVSDVSVMLGAEISTMGFVYQNKWYGSPKLGLNYGFYYKF